MTKDVMISANNNPQLNVDLFTKYQSYLQQRKLAIATMENQPWTLQEEPLAFERCEDFLEHWNHHISPLMKAEFTRFLEGGLEAAREGVKGLVKAAREGAEHLMDISVEPTPELYAKYVAYWTDANNSEETQESHSPPMRIEPFENFVKTWVEFPPHSQKEMAQWYEDGYEVTYHK